jgi:hypothetical protein
MIDIGKILKRAWNILWSYKVLWIFGVLLALTAGSGFGSNNGSSGSGYQFSGNNGQSPFNPETYNFGNQGPWMHEFNTWVQKDFIPTFTFPGQHIATLVWIGVGLLLFIIIVSVIGALIRYPSETAVIRMVDEYEQSGTKMKFKQGWKLGWSRRAFRMWVVDLVLSIPVILFVLLIGGLGLMVYLSTINGNEPALAASVIAAVGCSFLFLFLFILLMVLLGLLRQFFIRKIALEDTRVGEAFRGGWAMFKRNWKSGALMWLVMLGIGIGLIIPSLIVFLLLVPVYAILAIPAVIVAAIPGLIGFGIASLFTGKILAIIIGVLIATPFFITVLLAPLTLIGGWFKIFESNVWTLTYREMKALESNLPVELPAEPAK